jgi:hypothetical protein
MTAAMLFDDDGRYTDIWDDIDDDHYYHQLDYGDADDDYVSEFELHSARELEHTLEVARTTDKAWAEHTAHDQRYYDLGLHMPQPVAINPMAKGNHLIAIINKAVT